MTEHVDGDTAEHIQVGLPVPIGDHRTDAAGQGDRWDTVVVHHYRGPPLLHLFCLGHWRRSSPSLRSASSLAGSSAPLLFIASLCIVAARVTRSPPSCRCPRQ